MNMIWNNVESHERACVVTKFIHPCHENGSHTHTYYITSEYNKSLLHVSTHKSTFAAKNGRQKCNLCTKFGQK